MMVHSHDPWHDPWCNIYSLKFNFFLKVLTYYAMLMSSTSTSTKATFEFSLSDFPKVSSFLWLDHLISASILCSRSPYHPSRLHRRNPIFSSKFAICCIVFVRKNRARKLELLLSYKISHQPLFLSYLSGETCLNPTK